MSIKLQPIWDYESVSALHKEISEQINLSPTEITLDFSEVIQISTLGIQFLLSLFKTCKESKISLLYEGMNSEIEEFFQKLGLLEKIGYHNG